MKRLPIRLDVEMKPISVHANGSVAGPVITTQITNVGPGGVMVNLPMEQPAGTRFWVSTRLNGKRVEFYAIVRHVSVLLTGPQVQFAHGLQITAALATVMDEFDVLMKRFIKGESGLSAAPRVGGDGGHNAGSEATLAN
ncbi:MAG TPA: hypothetical protein VGK19_23985 [Capsulimonadaceae bacterium]|jgi:hypothetical protein